MTPKQIKRLQEKATSNIADAEPQIRNTEEKIAEGRPLDAEPDEKRKIARVAKVAQVSDAKAEELIEGNKREARPSLAKAGVEESIQGGSIDFDPIVFVESARIAANAVARVNGPEIGSGFLISPDLFITNNHVIDTAKAAQRTTVEFNFEEDRNLKARPITSFHLDPDKFFFTSDIEELDFTVVAVGDRIQGPLTLAQCGYLKLSDAGDKHTIGECANVIEHPDGNPKQIVLRENRIVARLDAQGVLLYQSDTLGGSSGSPVLNNQWEPIALHHWGGPHGALRNNGQAPDGVNEGIRISAIVGKLKAIAPTLAPAQRALLERALTMPSIFEGPESIASETKPRPVSLNGKLISKESETERKTPMTNQQEFTFTIPIEIIVRVPGLQATATAAQPTNAPKALVAMAEKVTPDPNFDNRNGYQATFIKGWQIPLPTLSDEGKFGSPARLIDAAADADPNELRYQNFSVVMNADRKMAYFTACNIDGSKSVPLARDGSRQESLPEVDEPEASEVWYSDERISMDDQHDQKTYSNQSPRLFDRGHQVRRLDPVWGRYAVRANADTFHFTNCCPQAWQFNEQVRYWAGIENYVLDNAMEEGLRVSVFTGPIFEDRKAFRYRDLLVPKAFFKIVARVEGGKKLVTAFIADQTDFLTDIPEGLTRPEAFDDTSKVKEYLSSVAQIEALTGVDFGDLRKFDTADGQEGVRRLTSYAQLREALAMDAYVTV